MFSAPGGAQTPDHQIDVIRNSVFNGKTQLIEGYKQKWPISFY